MEGGGITIIVHLRPVRTQQPTIKFFFVGTVHLTVWYYQLCWSQDFGFQNPYNYKLNKGLAPSKTNIWQIMTYNFICIFWKKGVNDCKIN